MATYPWPLVSGATLTAANLNAIGEWTAFTPSFSGVTAGTGASNTGQYCLLNQILFIRTKYVLGTGGSFTAPTLTLPASKVATGSPTQSYASGFQAVIIDLFANAYPLSVNLASTSTINFLVQTASGTYVTQNTAVSATIPFTSGTSDILEIMGWIQVD